METEAGEDRQDEPPSSVPPASDPPFSRERVWSAREAIAACAGVTVATALVMTYAFAPAQAGRPAMLVAIGALDALVAAFALYRMRKGGELGRRLRLARGDIWLGGMVAGLLYGAAMAAHLVITPHLSAREGWIMRLYLQLGDPRGEGREIVGLAVIGVAACEEIAWRGLVMRALEDVVSPFRALVLSSALFALAHAPTFFGLADPNAGPNPLLVMAGFGCSLVWGGLVLRTGRLVPAILAHALFSWSIVEFPIWRL